MKVTQLLIFLMLATPLWGQMPLHVQLQSHGNGCNNSNTLEIHISGGQKPYSIKVIKDGLLYYNTRAQKISGLNPGNYQVEVRDALMLSQQATIQIIPAYSVQLTSQPAHCINQTPGLVDYSITGSAGPFEMRWSDGQVQSGIIQLTGQVPMEAGNYRLSITNSQACELHIPIQVGHNNMYPAPVIQSVQTLACGSTSPSMNVSHSTGGAPYQFQWTTPMGSFTTQNLSNVTVGTYNLSLVSGQGCITNLFYEIIPFYNQPHTPTVQNQACLPNSGVAAFTNLPAQWSVEWHTNPVQNVPMGQQLPAGPVHYQLTNQQTGCIYPGTIHLPDSIVGNIHTQNANCPNADGRAWLQNLSGTAPYSYLWDNGETGDTANFLSGGIRNVVVQDAQGCTMRKHFLISAPSGQMSFIQSPEHTSCPGPAFYTDTVHVLSGTGPFSYFWNTQPAQFTQIATVRNTNSFSVDFVSVIDAMGCTQTQLVALPNTIPYTLSVSPPSCNAPGSATLSVNGGCSLCFYEWHTQPIQTTATAANLSTGTYSFKIENYVLGCRSTGIVTVPQAVSPLSPTGSFTYVSCNALNLVAVANSGTPPFTYVWDTPTPYSGDTLFGVPPGTYRCFISDINGCRDTLQISANQTMMQLQSGTGVVHCQGTDLWVAPQGGVAPFQYEWLLPQPILSDTLHNALPGLYVCRVTDSNGCTDTLQVLSPHYTMALQPLSRPSACSNGKAWVIPQQGMAPFTYTWNMNLPVISDTLHNLDVGTYRCIVSDGTGCTDSVDVAVSARLVSAAAIIQQQVYCTSASGILSAVVGAGIPPYSYNWSTNPAQNTQQATGLTAGQYLCQITDGEGCTFSVNRNLVLQNVTLTPTALVTGPEQCLASNGAISIALNSAGPYSIFWNTQPPDSGTYISGLSAGTYNWQAIDTFGCTGSGQATVIRNLASITASLQVTHTTCLSNDGSITALPANGTAPYTYTWSTQPVQHTQGIQQLALGSYSVVITDHQGCTGTFTEEVQLMNQQQASQIQIVSQILCNPPTGAVLSAVANGIQAPFTYLWSNGQTSAVIHNVPAGTWHVQITDAHGCTYQSAHVHIVHPQNTIPVLLSNTPAECSLPNGVVYAYPNGGTPPYQYTWNVQPSPTGNSIHNLHGNAIYSVSVTDAYQCSGTGSVFVPRLPCGTVFASGRLVHDINGNGVIDPGEPGIPNYPVTLMHPYRLTYTDVNGNYTIPSVPLGNRTVQVQTPTGFIQTSPAGNQVYSFFASNLSQTYSGINFLFAQGSNAQDLQVIGGTYMTARRGFPFVQMVRVINKGNTQVQPVLDVSYANHLQYTHSSVSAVQHTAQTKSLTYNLPMLMPFTDTLLYVHFLTSITSPLGQQGYFQHNVNPVGGDVTPGDNSEGTGVWYTGHYDPNDNMLIPEFVYGKIGDLGMMDSVLTYRIRFQNNGNDTCFNVLITDTLDPALKPETFEFLMATHTVVPSLDSAGILRFYFPNILLPDSATDEAGSQGAVFFRIKAKVQIGYTVKNTAHIYFDFNEAVVTNTSAYTWLDLETANQITETTNALQIYPNPTTDAWQLMSAHDVSWQLQTLEGKVIHEGKGIAGNTSQISAQALSPGIYLLRVLGASGINHYKIIRK